MPPSARDFVPPIVVSMARRMRGHGPRRRYASHAAALADCTQDAYENDELVRVIAEKTRRHRDALAAGAAAPPIDPTNAFGLAVLGRAALGRQHVRVVDFGGACGAHYFVARRFMPPHLALQWTVVETPAMVAAARSLATDELSFSDDLDAASRVAPVDLLWSSGTLQCVDAPRTWLDRLLAVGARDVLFGRIGLNDADTDVVTVHESMLSWNGIGPLPEGFTDRAVRYPFTFMSRSAFERAVAREHEVVATFADASGMFPVEGCPIVGFGLLAHRRGTETPAP